MARKAAEFDQFQVRLPPGMRERIKAASEENNRSMNAEIIARLEETFDRSLQSRLAEQEDIIGNQMGAIIEVSAKLAQTMEVVGTLNKHLATFGRAIQNATDGDTKHLDALMEAARRLPLEPTPFDED